ncbi:MAG: glycoside hydrolase family 5 protein [Clostridiaceae bacterium]|nr:glycoside hydrolase family 5 protein [Clostridiaceae bacterium]
MKLAKGINIGGYLSQCSHQAEHYETFFTEEDVQKIQAWGFDHIRLPFDYSVIQTDEGEAIIEGIELLRRNVLWCQKHGINIVLDLHKASGYDFNHAGDSGKNNLFNSDKLVTKFLELWKLAAKEFGIYTNVAFELLNEVVESENSDSWNALIKRAVKVIREIAPNTPIIYGGIRWNSADTLELLDPPASYNIIYTFHFYEPLLFTHQKAHWVKNISMENVSYPGSMVDYKAGSEMLGIQGEAVVNSEAEEINKAFIAAMIAAAVAAAGQAGVPLYCGEFGVIDQAPVSDTLRWLEDTLEAFSDNKIGHAIWTYKKMDFGLTDEHYSPIRKNMIRTLTK